MDNILFVNACISEGSRTLRLANHLLKHLEGHLTQLELQNEDDLLSLDQNQLHQRESGTYPTKYAQLLASADLVVVAAPFYDLSFPSILKT